MSKKYLIVTKYRWDSRVKKHNAMSRLMEASPDIDSVKFTTHYTNLGKPEVTNKRITEEWFEENISKWARLEGYDGAIFVFSMTDGTRWGLRSGLRGSTFKDNDGFGEMWVRSDERSVVRFKDGSKRDKYTKVIPHEIGHDLKHKGLTTLDIHDYDFGTTINNLEGFYKAFRIDKTKIGNLRQQWSMLSLLKDLLKGLAGMKVKSYHLPLPRKYWNYISQEFGVHNPIYPQTQTHIGTDFAVPEGTPIYAPYNGAIIERGIEHPSIGNWCVFRYKEENIRALHLKAVANIGNYRKGAVIAYSGSTGTVTGPHAHLEWWKRPVDISKLTRANLYNYVGDITKRFI